jgi:hypothetical protein
MLTMLWCGLRTRGGMRARVDVLVAALLERLERASGPLDSQHRRDAPRLRCDVRADPAILCFNFRVFKIKP